MPLLGLSVGQIAVTGFENEVRRASPQGGLAVLIAQVLENAFVYRLDVHVQN